jgi:gluconate 5-dehydrogenase
VALVTGSSGGLGKSLAVGLARNGVKVIINGRSSEKAQATVDEFNSKGYDTYLSIFDVTNSAKIAKAVADIEEHIGTPDIIVNNAGIQIRKNLEDFPEDDWDALMDTNLKSAFLVTKAFIKPMLERGSGKVVNICSMQSELGRATVSPYAAAKGGLKMLTRSMATEWAKHGIQINGIGPG